MYIGNQAVDNIYIGSNPVDAVYMGDTQVWSAIPADVKAHIARVTADGGTVPDQAKLVSTVKALMAAGLWDSCVFCAMPIAGVKKDGNQYVSKVYDLKANADLSQGTGTAQPKLNNGNLLYDGGDSLISSSFSVNNPIRNCLSSISVSCWVYIVNGTTYQLILNRWDVGNAGTDQFFCALRASGKLGVTLLGSSGAIKAYDTTANLGTGWKHIAFTYNLTDGLKIYVNGVAQSVTKNTDLANSNLRNSDSALVLSGRRIATTEKLVNGSKTDVAMIANSTWTAEQVTWLFNNTKLAGV